MTLKRLVLSALTLIVVVLVGSSLLGSLGQPQITNRLQLYQTNLLLSATEYEGDGSDQSAQLRKVLLGDDPLKAALTQYEEVRETAESDLGNMVSRLEALPQNSTEVGASENPAPRAQLGQIVQQQRSLLQQLDLNIGLIQAERGEVEAARTHWRSLIDTTEASSSATSKAIAPTAQTLLGLWESPPRIVPDAEPTLQNNLDGWFRVVALTRLYTLQQRPDALATLQAAQQQQAESTLLKLGIVGTVPTLAGIAGVGLIIFLIAQRLTQGKQAVLSMQGAAPWETAWDWEIIWQVLIVGFFFVGQIAVPLLLGGFSSLFTGFGTRARALYSMTYYLLMAGTGLLVLYLSIKQHFPLSKDWFQFKFNRKWILWGFGGYLVALPLMVLVSLVNQQIWQGQGGSNPLLQIVLEEGDPIALGIFLFTAAVAAPVFEEILFRGFLLPSLTRYVPVSGAIALSSLLFAIAHLSFSEVLPLATLGAVLGFVYSKSRNLLAPMLLHSLWNSITMVGLFILGSGAK
ncbi:CPBP family intramembrane glutamic endopeptidase [Leptolyngbya sp. AN02str]|uniref:CPBP family intramembrane glutamic endopeptidase n=1 Tax=Leptolyngbya sp. AN02str TaxID=3423363 RepID=UPI003D315BDD